MAQDVRTILQQLADHQIAVSEAQEQLDAFIKPATSGSSPYSFYDDPQSVNQNVDGQPQDERRPRIVKQLGGIAAEIGSLASQTIKTFSSVASTQLSEAVKEPAQPKTSGDTKRLSLRVVGRRVRLIGDSSVATVCVKGPHKLRSNSQALEIISEGEFRPRIKTTNLFALKPEQLKLSTSEELVIKVNPQLFLDAELSGVRLISDGVPFIGRLRISLGTARLTDVQQIENGLVQASNTNIEGSFNYGQSKLHLESGLAAIQLSADADVRIRANVQLGKISWPDHEKLDELIIARGTGQLELDVLMGRVNIRTKKA